MSTRTACFFGATAIDQRNDCAGSNDKNEGIRDEAIPYSPSNPQCHHCPACELRRILYGFQFSAGHGAG